MTNLGLELCFFLEISEKWYPIEFFWAIILCSFDRIDVFEQIWERAGVFMKKFEKNDMLALGFQEIDVYDKIQA